MRDVSPPFMSKPQNVNEALSDLAYMLYLDEENPTPKRDLLDSSKLDLSIESLSNIDNFLEKIREMELSDDEHLLVCLRAGAYTGEVIRRRSESGINWDWLDFQTGSELSQYVASLGYHIGTSAMLYGGDDRFVFPIAKVAKFLENGPEDSLEFYAQVVTSKNSPLTRG